MYGIQSFFIILVCTKDCPLIYLPFKCADNYYFASGGGVNLNVTSSSPVSYSNLPSTVDKNYYSLLATFCNQLNSVIYMFHLTAKLFNWNFHSLELVYRSRDPQVQVSENYWDLAKWRVNESEIRKRIEEITVVITKHWEPWTICF